MFICACPVWLTLITTFLAILGFDAYDKVVDKATAVASEKFSELAMPDLITNVNESVEKEVKKLVEEKINNVILDVDAKVESGIAQSIASSLDQSDVKLNEALKQIGNELKVEKFEEKTQKLIDSAVQKEKTLTADGWSFYGVRKGEEWTRKAFDIVEGNDDKNSTPDKQYKIQALTAVNIRKAAPTYTENEGYSYPGVKSVINEGETIVVQDVQSDQTPKGKYFWVQVGREHL